FAPGGGTDSIARELARNLSEKLGQSVVIENRGGGGGAIASRFVAKSEPDGHTLLFVTSTFVTHASVDTKNSYDVNKDYAPIAMIGRGPLMVVTHKNVGAKNLQQLIAVLKAKPDGLDFGTSGTGSVTHLAGELFKQRTGTNLTHVPYKGSGPATVDFLAGRTTVSFATLPTMLQHVKAGSVELLAMTGATRSPLFPNMPTVAESGIPNYNITTWWGVVAPAGTPEPIVKKLNELINEVSAKEPLKGRLVSEGAEAYRTTPAEFGKILSSELTMWKEVAKAANLKLD
ncbi:MAG: Fis family transcriptional regulator, partial [Herminiimonas sp.]|nr:Fis family transcriptional regulator [Herminiimonas sp.]